MDVDEDQAAPMFSECFWKFIKERVGIPKVYPMTTARQSKAKKVITFEERQDKIEKMLQKVEFDDNMLDQADDELAQW